ncbi:MAG: Flp pilus assembly protein CpaB [Candidatus Omnitrophica bacterium]|nr:Flp pilus assembly protein CpaB [Candidatus Omnitrophota bacterium]
MGRQHLLILGIAVIAALLGTAFLSGQFGGPKTIEGVAIAQSDIEPNSFIKAEQVRAGTVDATQFQSGMLFRPESAVGQIVRVEIHEGEPITAGMVYSGTAGLQHIIPPGYRALSVPVNQPENDLKLFIPGSRIDIIATVQDRHGNFRTGTIMENVLLLAKEKAGEGRQGVSFIVAIDPKGAEKLSLAIGHGEIRVALRQESDESLVDGTGIGIGDLIKGMEPDPNSDALIGDAYEPGSIEVIRGTRKTTDYFEEGNINKISGRIIQQE